MAVYFVATVVLVFYMNAIPVKLALATQVQPQMRTGIGLAIFEGRFALRGAQRRMEKPKKKVQIKPRSLSAAWRSGKYLLKHLQLESLVLQGRVHFENAANTALFCGSAGAIEASLRPLLPPDRLHIALQPDFSGMSSDLELCGMVSLRAGHIIIAALIGAWHYCFTGGTAHGKASH